MKLFDITTCSNLIYEEYSTSKDEINVACNHNVCGVKCKNGAEAVYVDDLGIRESRRKLSYISFILKMLHQYIL